MIKLLSSYINFVMAQYIIEPKKTLKKWCRSHVKMCSLTNFEYVYCKNPNKIDLYELSKNNTIMAKLILKKYPIDWQRLSYNSSKWAYKLLDNIDWILLSKNPSRWARKLLKNNPDKINWNYLSENPSRWAYKLLMTEPYKIDYDYVSSNESKWAYRILDKIDYDYMTINTSKWAWKILKKN